MLLKKSQWTSISILAVFTGLLISILFKEPAVITEREDDHSSSENTFAFASSAAITPILGQSTAKQIPPKIHDVPLVDIADREIFNHWREARGHNGPQNEVYQNYDKDTLEALVAQGDMRAMHTLADLYLDSELALTVSDSYTQAQLLYWKAAQQGSTMALEKLAFIEELKLSNHELPTETRRMIELQALAYLGAADIRGDRWPSLVYGRGMIDRQNIKVTADDEWTVSQGAEHIYNQLLAERIEMGLGEFDNSVPSQAQKLFEWLETQPTREKIDNQ